MGACALQRRSYFDKPSPPLATGVVTVLRVRERAVTASVRHSIATKGNMELTAGWVTS